MSYNTLINFFRFLIGRSKDETMKNLNSEEFKHAIDQDGNGAVVDVRTPGECAAGIIPGAINIDLFNPGNFKEKINALDKSKNYYVYCRSGNRSAQACGYMESVGIGSTYNLSGGMNDWPYSVAEYQEV